MEGYGALCRVLLYSNLAYEALNTVILEISTPYYVEPNGLLLCFTTPDFYFVPDNFTVTGLEEGGDQFTQGTTFFSTGSIAESTSFFQSTKRWQHRVMEFGTIPDVLGTDAFYAASYYRRRYDNLRYDEKQASLSGLVADPVQNEEANTRRSALYEQMRTSEDLSIDELEDLLIELADAGRPYGNCVLLSGSWKAGTRYEVQFEMLNPAPPSTNMSAELELWMAPITYEWSDDEERQHVLYSVRGSKMGQICPAKEGVEVTLYDACNMANATGDMPFNSTVQDCLAALEMVTTPSPTEPSASLCPNGTVWAPAVPPSGDCVHCGVYGMEVVSVNGGDPICECNASTLPLLAGDVACGELRGVSGKATSGAELAQELCQEFAIERTKLLAEERSDQVVHEEYVKILLDQAKSILDPAVLLQTNKTYQEDMLFDERRRDMPSRHAGLAPNCMQCDGDGNFVDFARDDTVPLDGRDRRFDAVHTLRYIGYVLHSIGHTCDELYDPDNQYRDIYGPYQEELCEAL